MKTNDVVNILRERLPQLVSSFHTTQAISSLTATGGVATANLAVANTDIETGDKVLITGALVNNTITSLTQTGGVATAITENIHDLTAGYSSVVISGATQAEYNGTFELVSVIDENTFTFNVDSGTTSPATGSPVLMENTEIDFNGYYEITKITTTQFTYNITNTSSLTATGSPILNYNFRIHGSVSIERALEAYTKQALNNLFLFIETEGTVSNKDRFNVVDSNYIFKEGQEFTQNCIQTINFYFIAPCKTDMLATTFKDSMEDLRPLLFSSLLSLKFSDYLASNNVFGFTFKEDATEFYDGAKYIHRFTFESIYEITKEDIATPENGVAFRNITLNWLNENEVIEKTDTIKLP